MWLTPKFKHGYVCAEATEPILTIAEFCICRIGREMKTPLLQLMQM